MRLKPIAANRAAVNATTVHASVRTSGIRVQLASTTPTSANGSANTVWGSLTKLA